MIARAPRVEGRKVVFAGAGEAACRLGALAALVPFVPALVVSPAAAAPGDARAAALERRLGDGAEVKAHEETGKVRFIGTEPGEPLAAPDGASPPAAARAFLDDNAKAFGLDDPSRELRVEATDDLAKGRSSVRLQQVHRGVPIIAGELGVDKVAKLYYEVESNLLTSGSDYLDLHGGLRQRASTRPARAGSPPRTAVR